ncbi:hypothetical protein ACLEPN_30820 [Myxococcus sp. 1LA]
MLPYFPFEQDVFSMSLGVRALRPEETLIEVDAPRYAEEVALKEALLTAGTPRASRAAPERRRSNGRR